MFFTGSERGPLFLNIEKVTLIDTKVTSFRKGVTILLGMSHSHYSLPKAKLKLGSHVPFDSQEVAEW